MNTREKKIFFLLFAFNLFILIGIVAVGYSFIVTVINYAGEGLDDYANQFNLLGKIVGFIMVLVVIFELKPLYRNTKKATYNYLEKMKDH